MNTKSLAFGSLALMLLTGCSSSPYVSEAYRGDYNFTDVKSYYLQPKPTPYFQTYYIRNNRNPLEEAINQRMQQLGMVASSKETADIWIDYDVYVAAKNKLNALPPSSVFNGESLRGPHELHLPINVTYYMDLINPNDGLRVWTGVSGATIASPYAENRWQISTDFMKASLDKVPGWKQ